MIGIVPISVASPILLVISLVVLWYFTKKSPNAKFSKFAKYASIVSTLGLFMLIISLNSEVGEPEVANVETSIAEVDVEETTEPESKDKKKSETESKKQSEEEQNRKSEEESKKAAESESKKQAEEESKKVAESESKKKAEENLPDFEGYNLITVDGGNQSGYRQANVVVDIGYGAREYWAYTNAYGQLVKVVADEIVLQDDSVESVNSNGRYYPDEAKVPGTESDSLDEGHVIADSLGGVSNAYNITPQNSTLNRHGDQAYMERVIRDAGGATDFVAIITYPNNETQIPNHYEYTYTVAGNRVTDSFDNINPDELNESLGLTGGGSSGSSSGTGNSGGSNSTTASSVTPSQETSTPVAPGPSGESVSSVDTNGNGTVTIKEAEAAGFSMPIKKGHWLYEYMRDSDSDGLVGE